MDLRKQFKVKNNVDYRRFEFESIDNNSCSYRVSYFECDANENNAWICIWKAKKKELETI